MSAGLSAKLADKLGRIVRRHEDLAGSLATEGRVDPRNSSASPRSIRS